MTPDRDVSPKPQSIAYPTPSQADRLDDDSAAAALFQEINERRARIEKSELLRQLRSL